MNSILTVLILIGYSDYVKLDRVQDVFSHTYYYRNAEGIEKDIKFKLMVLGKTNVQFTILNANVNCPGEDPERTVRFSICDEQIKRSDSIKKFLDRELTHFDEFIYIGHARRGSGLGIGPYVPQYTYPMRFYRPSEGGNLKRVFMASCLSNEYYRDAITYHTQIDFQGADGRGKWTEDLLPLVLDEIKSIVKNQPAVPAN